MTEQLTTEENIDDLIEKHQKAIEQLEAVQQFNRMRDIEIDSAESFEHWGLSADVVNERKESADHYQRCANRVYRNYFHKWVLNNSEIKHGDGLPM